MAGGGENNQGKEERGPWRRARGGNSREKEKKKKALIDHGCTGSVVRQKGSSKGKPKKPRPSETQVRGVPYRDQRMARCEGAFWGEGQKPGGGRGGPTQGLIATLGRGANHLKQRKETLNWKKVREGPGERKGRKN